MSNVYRNIYNGGFEFQGTIYQGISYPVAMKTDVETISNIIEGFSPVITFVGAQQPIPLVAMGSFSSYSESITVPSGFYEILANP